MPGGVGGAAQRVARAAGRMARAHAHAHMGVCVFLDPRCLVDDTNWMTLTVYPSPPPHPHTPHPPCPFSTAHASHGQAFGQEIGNGYDINATV